MKHKVQDLNQNFLQKLDQFVFDLLVDAVDRMPQRFVKLIAHYYTDARVRRLYFKKLGVLMGEGTYANLGMKVITDYQENAADKNKTYPVTIGNRVSIGPNLTLISQSSANNGEEINALSYVQEVLTQNSPIQIEDEVWIGANVVILPGVTVGKCSVIGAGAVVTTNIEPYSVYAGVPAKKIRSLMEQEFIDL